MLEVISTKLAEVVVVVVTSVVVHGDAAHRDKVRLVNLGEEGPWWISGLGDPGGESHVTDYVAGVEHDALLQTELRFGSFGRAIDSYLTLTRKKNGMADR